MSADLVDVFDRPPLRGQWLTHRDVRRLKERWRKAFAAPLHQATGAWSLGQHDWHVFSHGYSVHEAQGIDAIRQYDSQVPTDLIVLWDHDFVAFQGDFALMPHARVGHDVYVFDEELTWTMAFTHELELGPFFATAASVRSQLRSSSA